MALLNRPLTEDEARQFVIDWRKAWPAMPSFYDMLQKALREPRPHVMRYSAANHSVMYVPPTHFYIHSDRTPSDCEWHIPGSEKKGF